MCTYTCTPTHTSGIHSEVGDLEAPLPGFLLSYDINRLHYTHFGDEKMILDDKISQDSRAKKASQFLVLGSLDISEHTYQG